VVPIPGTLFLDQSLRIKRFTSRVAELFSITASDGGLLAVGTVADLALYRSENLIEALLHISES
jgi:hypothetical protein